MQHGGHITKDLLGPRGVPVGGDDIPYGIYDDPELGVYNQTHYAL